MPGQAVYPLLLRYPFLCPAPQVDRRSASRKFLRTATGQRVRVPKAPLEAGGAAVYIINEVCGDR